MDPIVELPTVLAALVLGFCVPAVKYGWAALEAALPVVATWKADAKLFGLFILSYALALGACALAQQLALSVWVAAGATVFAAANAWHRAGTPNRNGGIA